MKKFILPEKWVVKSNNKEEDEIILTYINETYNCTIPSFDGEHNTWYYSNISHEKDRNNHDHGSLYTFKDNDCTEITYDQFVKYVLNENELVIQESYKPDLELETILIRLLNT